MSAACASYGAGRAELALAPGRLVVDVREAVLVQVHPAGPGPHGQLGRQRRVQLGRDHREVDRQRPPVEQVEQRPQPLVAPAGVVVAEEHRARALVQRPPDRIEPAHRTASSGVATSARMRGGALGPGQVQPHRRRLARRPPRPAPPAAAPGRPARSPAPSAARRARPAGRYARSARSRRRRRTGPRPRACRPAAGPSSCCSRPGSATARSGRSRRPGRRPGGPTSSTGLRVACSRSQAQTGSGRNGPATTVVRSPVRMNRSRCTSTAARTSGSPTMPPPEETTSRAQPVGDRGRRRRGDEAGVVHRHPQRGGRLEGLLQRRERRVGVHDDRVERGVEPGDRALVVLALAGRAAARGCPAGCRRPAAGRRRARPPRPAAAPARTRTSAGRTGTSRSAPPPAGSRPAPPATARSAARRPARPGTPGRG